MKDIAVVRKILLTLGDDDGLRIATFAAAARLPVAVFCRSKLINGEWPAPAPALLKSLTVDALKLLSMISRLRGNLTQLHSRAEQLELTQFTGLLGPLATASAKLLTTGQMVKGGKFSADEIVDFLTKISERASDVNDLSAELNLRKEIPTSQWDEVLDSLSAALEV